MSALGIYTVSFENVTWTAVQDLVSVKGAGLFVCRVRRVWFGMTNTTLQTAQGVRLNLKKSTATFTAGTGGSAATPRPLEGATAATFTARVNDTAQGTTSGAFTSLYPSGLHNYGGFHLYLGDKGPTFGLNEAIIFEALSTISGATPAFSGGMEVQQIG
jgi:hypothetical protein